MAAKISNLFKKINLQSDPSYEDFCDVLHDNCLSASRSLIAPGKKKRFGNCCCLQMIESVPVDATENHDFLSQLLAPWGWDVSSFDFVHSRLFLHMQAEENIKIDIIWIVDESCEPEQPYEYTGVATFFEDNGQGAFDEGPNFAPKNSAYWDEFLCDMGIGSDPYPDPDE